MEGEFKMFSDCFRRVSVMEIRVFCTELSHHACTELSYSQDKHMKIESQINVTYTLTCKSWKLGTYEQGQSANTADNIFRLSSNG